MTTSGVYDGDIVDDTTCCTLDELLKLSNRGFLAGEDSEEVPDEVPALQGSPFTNMNNVVYHTHFNMHCTTETS